MTRSSTLNSTLNLPNGVIPGRRPSMLIVTDHLIKNTINPGPAPRKVSTLSHQSRKVSTVSEIS